MNRKGGSIAVTMLLFACNSAPTPTKDAPTKADPAAQKAGAAKQPSAADAKGNGAADSRVMDDCPGGENKTAEAKGDDHTCDHGATKPASDQTHFGKAFAVDKRESLTDAAARLEEGAETVQVSGTVDAVCQKKGCWMILKDGDVTARVFTHAGEFFLPIGTSKGRKAVVEGKLEARTMSEKFAKHLAEDKGEDPSKVTGPRKELVIKATSVELL